MIYLGILYVAIGLWFFSIGITAEIPKPNKGFHFIYIEDGYKIEPHELNGGTYDNGDKVNILTMEKEK